MSGEIPGWLEREASKSGSTVEEYCERQIARWEQRLAIVQATKLDRKDTFAMSDNEFEQFIQDNTE